MNDLEAVLKQAQSQFEIYRYDAQHALMNEARPEICAASAKASLGTLDFLKHALAEPPLSLWNAAACRRFSSILTLYPTIRLPSCRSQTRSRPMLSYNTSTYNSY